MNSQQLLISRGRMSKDRMILNVDNNFKIKSFLLFRLQEETTPCVCGHVVSQRQQVCSKDEIVILLYDRLR